MGGRFLSRRKQQEMTKNMKKYLVTAAFIGAFALTATGASAAVVCNDEGDCWKVKEKYTYPPDVHVQVYDDDWKWEGDKYRWRDPGVGRGYYRGGVWIGF
jgi:hypothetical protein